MRYWTFPSVPLGALVTFRPWALNHLTMVWGVIFRAAALSVMLMRSGNSGAAAGLCVLGDFKMRSSSWR